GKAWRAGKASAALRLNVQEDIDYDIHTIKAPKLARWYTRLWPACLGPMLRFTLYFSEYDPVGQFQRVASIGDAASVERLINFHVCRTKEYDKRGRMSLHYACAHNHPDVITLLLSNSANINI
ncbi:hypothetical protein A6R68_17663, partial [Neotoma lepida]